MVDREHKRRELTLPNETKIYTDNIALEPESDQKMLFGQDEKVVLKMFHCMLSNQEKNRKQYYDGVEIIDVRDLESCMTIERDARIKGSS